MKPKAWKAEVATLTAQKDRLYAEIRSLKAEVQEVEAINNCVKNAYKGMALHPEQKKTQTKRRDMEL